ncbi:MAG TPA: TfpX/TfpZ family type IV pilin accessory protein [Burkholderiales bacterium]|jgi:hypothetical protein|nr:TfpX/TfpZ family type IV pilin accessory protein [Burkholderiales bacterium]
MAARALSRWQASGLHLAISAAVAASSLALILGLWFPGPLFEAAGGLGLLYLLVGVDVVLGPLLTLIVYKSGKPGMKFDLAVIGTLQVMALAYGFSVVALVRPAFVVFVVDRFELVSAIDLKPEDLAAARYEEFRSVPWTGPRLAAADVPTEPAERQRLIQLAFSGLDLQNFPRYYVPYAERTKQVLARAVTVERLRQTEPETAKAVDAWLASSGTKPGSVRALLLRTRFAWIAVLVDPVTAQPVKYLTGERIT